MSAERAPLGFVRAGKKVSEMTKEERRAFAAAIWEGFAARYAAAKEAAEAELAVEAATDARRPRRSRKDKGADR
jgi:hypothetical protein